MDCVSQGKQALDIDESGLQEGVPQSACPAPRSWILQTFATHLHPSTFLFGSWNLNTRHVLYKCVRTVLDICMVVIDHVLTSMAC